MIDGRRVLAIIPARGGSKGLPRKNVLSCAGKPLIACSIEAAANSRLVDHAIVSTDDEEIIEVARQHGGVVPFVRPVELASDTAAMDEVAIHALESLESTFDVCVLLQSTSPLRTAGDIDAALERMSRLSARSVVSLSPSPKSPHWMYAVDAASSRMTPLLAETSNAVRRQDLPTTFVLNGAVYAIQVAALLSERRWVLPDSVGYVMPSERSIDIDSEVDFVVADYLLRRSLRE